MNNQETIDQINAKIKELQAEVDKLKAEPDTSELVFKPKDRERYEYIGYLGVIKLSLWDGSEVDFDRLKAGNVFRVGTAKNSAKYFFMNSEYGYWLPWTGQPKPKVLPKGLEYLTNTGEFVKALKLRRVEDMQFNTYRWKRSEQV